MDHPDDQHALLDPNLPTDDGGLAVLTAGFDQDPNGAQAAVAGDGSPQQRDQQQQQHSGSSAVGGQPQQPADGYPHPDAAYGFSAQGHNEEGDLLSVHERPPGSDDGHSAAGGGDNGSVSGGGGSNKRRRSGPPGGVELDLSTPEGQAKKKQRAARAAYMRDYRKKKSLGKAGGKSEDGMGVGTSASHYDEIMNGYEADKLKQLDMVDPSITGQNGSGFGGYGMAVNLHNAGDGAFHDDLALQAPFVPRSTTFAHPAQLAVLPVPRLKFLFHLELELDVAREVGEGPYGRRSFAAYKGGQWEGPGSRGTVAPGGGETMTIDLTTSEAQMDCRFVLTTNDGANIFVTSSGTQTGAKDVLDSLAGDNQQLHPNAYTCRHTIRIETGDGRYKWLNKTICVASAGRAGSLAVYDVYQLC